MEERRSSLGLWGWQMALLTSRPDGKKKAYVRLTADHDALEVANKVSSCSYIPRTLCAKYVLLSTLDVYVQPC